MSATPRESLQRVVAVLAFVFSAVGFSFSAQPGSRTGVVPRLVAQLGHFERITSATLSSDGHGVLTTAEDGAVILWEEETGGELRRFCVPDHSFLAAAFSLDGKRVAAGGLGAVFVWDSTNGREIRRFRIGDRSGWAQSLAFSSDADHVIAGYGDGSVRLWDVGTGEMAAQFGAHSKSVESIAWASDRSRYVTGSRDGSARLWETATGTPLAQLNGHGKAVVAVACSPDSSRILTGSADGTARLWDAESGKELHRFLGQPMATGKKTAFRRPTDIHCVGFLPDGRRVFTGGADAVVRLWDAVTGQELRRFVGHTGWVSCAAVSRDGARLLTGSFDASARLWQVDSGQELRRLQGRCGKVSSVAWARDGRHVLVGRRDAFAHLWNLAQGRETRRFAVDEPVRSVDFSPDGSAVLVGGEDDVARLWKTETGKALCQLTGHSEDISSVAFSADGSRVVTGSWDGTTRLWDPVTGTEVDRLKGGQVECAAFSPNGRFVAVAGGSFLSGAEVRLWEPSTDRVGSLEGLPGLAWSVAFSPDGARVIASTLDGETLVWRSATGELIRRFKGGNCLAFSGDGGLLATGFGSAIRLWDTDTWQELCRMEGDDAVVAVAFSPNGRFILSGHFGGVVAVWDAHVRKELCRMVSFADGTWAVTDADGRFDAANGGDVQGLHWVVGRETIDLLQLKERYYEPGLLAKKLGFDAEPLRDVRSVQRQGIELHPATELCAPTRANPKLGIKLSNRGGGIGRVQVLVNGKEVAADARGADPDPDADGLLLEIDLADHPYLIPGTRNAVSVRAYSEDGFVAGGELFCTYAPDPKPVHDPHLWCIAVGVSDYAGDRLDLRFAAKDADDFAEALKLAATRFFGGDCVHLTLLSTTRHEESVSPTRANIVRAFEQVREARPTDVLVVYLAGHGVNHGGVDGDYYYVTRDATSLAIGSVKEHVAISGDELTDLIKKSPALKQVLVLDTCASGHVAEKLAGRRSASASQVRAMERLKDRTGMYVLAGCAADAVSYEASRYGQGLLTFSLLKGMRVGRLRQDEYVDVSGLFAFAADHVPEIAEGIGGIQRPIVATPSAGASFDIGRLTPEDRRRIPLASDRPVFLQTSLESESPPFLDHLGLSARLNAALRDASLAGQSRDLWFVEASEAPDAYTVSGRYRMDGQALSVTAYVVRNGEAAHHMEFVGSTNNLGHVSAGILAELQHFIRESTARSPHEGGDGKGADGK
jgi:WD40 repeat protein